MSAGDITRAIDGLLGAQFETDAWKLNGACVGANPEWFFPTPGNTTMTDAAVSLCNKCPVRVKCLTYALETDSAWGIWGATTEKQRKQIKENSDAA